MRKLVQYMITAITALFTRARVMNDQHDEPQCADDLTVEDIKANIDKLKSAIARTQEVKNDQMTAVAWSMSSMFGETRRANRFNQ